MEVVWNVGQHFSTVREKLDKFWGPGRNGGWRTILLCSIHRS